MNLVRTGRIVRTLRRRRGWRQVDLAARAVCSRQVVSLVECGRASRVSLRAIDRIVMAHDAELDLMVRWRGGELERLLDEGHARLVGAIAGRLEADGWIVRIEVTYVTTRERGSIDLVAFRPLEVALLVVEVKSELLSADSTTRKHDEKVRLGSAIVRDRFGWQVRETSRLLVLPRSTTAWRHVTRHASVFDRLYPLRGAALRRWLAHPVGSVGGVMFVPDSKPAGVGSDLTARRRVTQARRPRSEHDTRAQPPSGRRQLAEKMPNATVHGT